MNDKRQPGRGWKIALAVLIGTFVVGMALSMVAAARRVSRVVDADYYRHGLQYGAVHGRGGAEAGGGTFGGRR